MTMGLGIPGAVGVAAAGRGELFVVPLPLGWGAACTRGHPVYTVS
jgi:hypothetical protein